MTSKNVTDINPSRAIDLHIGASSHFVATHNLRMPTMCAPIFAARFENPVFYDAVEETLDGEGIGDEGWEIKLVRPQRLDWGSKVYEMRLRIPIFDVRVTTIKNVETQMFDENMKETDRRIVTPVYTFSSKGFEGVYANEFYEHFQRNGVWYLIMSCSANKKSRIYENRKVQFIE